MTDERDGRYVRYEDDETVLAAIGSCVTAQTGPVTVHLPRPLAEAAIAAWNRDENTEPPQETPPGAPCATPPRNWP